MKNFRWSLWWKFHFRFSDWLSYPSRHPSINSSISLWSDYPPSVPHVGPTLCFQMETFWFWVASCSLHLDTLIVAQVEGAKYFKFSWIMSPQTLAHSTSEEIGVFPHIATRDNAWGTTVHIWLVRLQGIVSFRVPLWSQMPVVMSMPQSTDIQVTILLSSWPSKISSYQNRMIKIIAFISNCNICWGQMAWRLYLTPRVWTI